MIELLPVLAAFAVHAVSHGRILLVAPVALGLVVAIWRGVRLQRSRALLVWGAAGAVAGFAMLFVSEPPAGPIPAAALSPLCGALVGLTAFCVLTRNTTFAWIYAWLLAVLSLHRHESPPVIFAFVALAAMTFVAIFLRARFFGAAASAMYLVFCAVTVGGTVLLVHVVQASEGALMGAVYRFTRDIGLSGLGLQGDLAVAAYSEVKVSSQPLLELSGAPVEKLRTVVLDRFDGRLWTTSRALLAPGPALPGGGAYLTELLLLEELSPILPAPAGTTQVTGAKVDVEGASVLRAPDREKGLTIALRHGAPQLPPESPGSVELPAELRAQLEPLARRIAGEGTPRQRASRLEAFFHREFTYSLRTDLRARRRHPLVVLIEEKRPAYCTYFASAMAAMLRSLDIPARVVGGFLATEQNPLTGRTVVRQRDAHAWVEVWLDGRYVAFDPTPAREAARGEGFLSEVRAALLSELRRIWLAPGKVVRSPFTLLALAALVAWRLARYRRKRRPAGSELQPVRIDPQLAAAHRRFVKALRLRPAPAETDDELVARLSAGDARLANDFLAAYRRARYGGGQLDPAAIDRTLAALERR